MKSRQTTMMVVIVLLALGGLIGSFAFSWSPLLGLDLQGGVSVRLQSTEPNPDVELLDETVEILRSRIDALGVAEPEISRTENGVLVQLPGVDDTDRALELVGTTAELRFRPVCSLLAPATVSEDGTVQSTDSPSATDQVEIAPTTVAPATATTVAPSTTTTLPDEVGFQDGTTTTISTSTVVPSTTIVDGSTITVDDPPENSFASDDCSQVQLGLLSPTVGDDGLTPREEDNAEDFVILAETPIELEDGSFLQNRYLLGPSMLTGEGLSDAAANLANFEWAVFLEFESGELGIDAFNRAAATCFSGLPACPGLSQGETGPVGSLAMVLDSEVVTAPRINSPSFERDQITITGNMAETEARDIALALRFGSLPLELEQQSVQEVSASVGSDALRAGVIAGLVGLVIVSIFVIAYYRLLGVVAILSLAVSSALLWTIIALLGESAGLALTLAGVTGIIVSVGVSVDSNIVYYEHIKEDILNGRVARSSVDRAFPVAFSTIVKADIASLISATLLYLLTVGAVRGFALYLGLATILDLVATYFFMGPAVRLLSNSEHFANHPKAYGLPESSLEEVAR